MEKNPGEVSPDSKDTVAKDVYENVMKDLQTQKAKARELEDKLKSYNEQKEQLERKSLADKEEWKKLAEIREKEAEDFKKKLEVSSKNTTNYFKRAEIRQQALKQGIRETALEDIDLLPLDDVQVETTSTGKINVLGADKFIDRLKTTRAHWFNDKSDPGVVTGTPTTTTAKGVTPADAVKLYREGKMAEYNEAMNKIRTQKRG